MTNYTKYIIIRLYKKQINVINFVFNTRIFCRCFDYTPPFANYHLYKIKYRIGYHCIFDMITKILLLLQKFIWFCNKGLE